MRVQKQISEAQKRLPSVTVSRNIKLKVATVCSNLNIDGLRGDLVVNRAAQALVAFEGRTSVRVPAPLKPLPLHSRAYSLSNKTLPCCPSL